MDGRRGASSFRVTREWADRSSGATTLECDVRFPWFADEIPHWGCQFRSGGPLVVRPPWNAMFVFRGLRTKSHIGAVSSDRGIH
jgi:hypothetical protein